MAEMYLAYHRSHLVCVIRCAPTMQPSKRHRSQLQSELGTGPIRSGVPVAAPEAGYANPLTVAHGISRINFQYPTLPRLRRDSANSTGVLRVLLAIYVDSQRTDVPNTEWGTW